MVPNEEGTVVANDVKKGAEMTVIYLVSSFGFSGSPGEWTAFGRATEEYHRAHRPGNARRDGRAGFCSKILVDDNILVEPMVGLRPWVSARRTRWKASTRRNRRSGGSTSTPGPSMLASQDAALKKGPICWHILLLMRSPNV